jgi:hypothetical protein
VREGAPAVGREAVARVEPLQLGEREVCDAARAVGRPRDGLVVDEDDRAVGGEPHVGLDHVGAERGGPLEGVERVLGPEAGAAPVGDDERARRALAEEGAFGRGRARRPGHRAVNQA